MPRVSALMDPMTKRFVASIHGFVREHGLDLVGFEKGQRKDDIAEAYLADMTARRGSSSWAEPRRNPGVPQREAGQPDTGAAYRGW